MNTADLAAYIAARVKDGVYDYDQLLDLSQASMDVVSGEVLKMVREARRHLADKPIPFTALVARPGTATYGLARQLATLFDFDGASVHVADSVEAASRWLDQVRSEEPEGRFRHERSQPTPRRPARLRQALLTPYDQEVPCEKTANARAVPATAAPAVAASRPETVGDSKRRPSGRRFSIS